MALAVIALLLLAVGVVALVAWPLVRQRHWFFETT